MRARSIPTTSATRAMSNGNSPVNGFLILNKPSGPTSMDAVSQITRLTGQRKRVGHGGTLDPLAEGVLPICFGQATRLMEYLINYTKDYLLEVHLGVTTETYDSEGRVVKERDTSHITQESVEEALQNFCGTIYQTPPMYSSIKVEGRRLYQLARQGIEVERVPRKVQVHRLTLEKFHPPFLLLEVECGRGVYMRSLAHDLGELLGCGGYAKSLTRLRSGPFRLNEAVPPEAIQDAVEEGHWRELIRPLDFLLLGMKSTTVSTAAEQAVRNGQSISLGPGTLYAGYLESYRLYTRDGRFLAVVRFDRAKNRWDPYKVFHIEEVSPYAHSSG